MEPTPDHQNRGRKYVQPDEKQSLRDVPCLPPLFAVCLLLFHCVAKAEACHMHKRNTLSKLQDDFLSNFQPTCWSQTVPAVQAVGNPVNWKDGQTELQCPVWPGGMVQRWEQESGDCKQRFSREIKQTLIQKKE